jgi:hypothetical protein
LDYLLNKIITKVNLDTSTTFAINADKNASNFSKMELVVQIHFEDFLLNVYNPIKISPSYAELKDLIGHRVMKTYESKDKAEIIFESNYKLKINMREEAYFGPEAMCLYGPNNFCAVWS